MDISWENLIIFLAIGLIAGWLASAVMQKSTTLLTNLIIGGVGSIIGGYLFTQFNIAISGEAFIDKLIAAFVGALILLFLVRIIK